MQPINNYIEVTDRNAWRQWLEKNAEKTQGIWLVLYHKSKNKLTPQLSYDAAVEEALCFGWIDATTKKRNLNSYYRYFAKRKPNSIWSDLNRQRASLMIEAKKMTKSGYAAITAAKKSGSWLKWDEAKILPEDLRLALLNNSLAQKHFYKFPPSSQRVIIEWLLQAKRQETRQKRITEIVHLAERNLRANHY